MKLSDDRAVASNVGRLLCVSLAGSLHRICSIPVTPNSVQAELETPSSEVYPNARETAVVSSRIDDRKNNTSISEQARHKEGKKMLLKNMWGTALRNKKTGGKKTAVPLAVPRREHATEESPGNKSQRRTSTMMARTAASW